MLTAMIAAALFAAIPRDPWPVDHCDALEINTVHDHDGQHRFTQALWLDIGGPNEIRDWRFFNNDMRPTAGWALFEDKGRLRAVHVTYRRPIRSHTYTDPEVDRRKIQPLLFRRRLTGSTD